MKTKNLLIATVLCAITMTACTKSENNTIKESTVPLSDLLTPKDSAIADIDFYDSLCRKKLVDVSVRAYTIRSQELLVAMGLDSALLSKATYKNIRVYLAYQPKSQKESKGSFKLYVVPVVGANLNVTPAIGGEDVMLDKNGHGIKPRDLASYPNGDQYMLDLNTPCPNTCATNEDLLTKKKL